jgi:hypothetical protein
MGRSSFPVVSGVLYSVNELRWLELAVLRGLVRQDGSGKKSDPYRYWLPDREELMRPDEGASREELQAWNDRIMKGFWQAVERKSAKAEGLQQTPPARRVVEAVSAEPEGAAAPIVPVPADQSNDATSQAAKAVGPAAEPAARAAVPVVGGASPIDEGAARGAGDAARGEALEASAASAVSAPAQKSASAGCPPFTPAPIVHTEPDHAAIAERRRSRRWPGQG